MKLKNFNKYQIIFILITILSNSTNLIYASEQVIKIYSKYQCIDILTNTILFQDNVKLKYKQIELYANKIMINYNQDIQYLSMIKAYGNPIILNQEKKPGRITSIQSSKAYYNIADNIITFTGNVRIEQSGNSIQSDNIIYSINQKKIQAISQQGNKTITILQINPI